MKTLGKEIGVGERQAQKYVAQLEREKLIRRVRRFSDRGQTSNVFEFLWHAVFEARANDCSGEGANDGSGEGANNGSPKESQFEESKFEETNTDLDSPPTNRKNRDSRLDSGGCPSLCKKYSQLREALADYMVTPDDPERVYPSDRQVVDVMDAAGGATEEETIRCLHYLRDERRLHPGTKHGPRKFGWFKTVVGDYFQQKREREAVYSPPAVSDTTRLSQGEIDSMTDSLTAPVTRTGDPRSRENRPNRIGRWSSM
jgi:hypothetical protein